MPNILTPKSIWSNLDVSLDVCGETVSNFVEDGIKYEKVYLSGRETGEGRVKIFGTFAADEKSPSNCAVLIIPDSEDTVNKDILKMFVKKGYSAFMADIRGVHEGVNDFTIYPKNIEYANNSLSGRFKNFVDDSADKTAWFEWVGVGAYARKYLLERPEIEKIAALGIRDGGEVVWKLVTAADFCCAVTVGAAGWLAYKGLNKFAAEELELNEERYRFLGGVDSQAYAPYVKCPMQILCTSNDVRFDYDRAYDTFSRINPDFAADSVIAYSITCNSCVDGFSTNDMFMFLDKHVKNRQVFIPKPIEINLSVDEGENLIAKVLFDAEGDLENFTLFMSENCKDSSLRDWTAVPIKRKLGEREYEFYLNVYEKTTSVFLLCKASYTNGFTDWSKVVSKKISGAFRNMQPKRRVLYSVKSDGVSGFLLNDTENFAVGGMFLPNSAILPQIVTKTKNLQGLFCVGGLLSYRVNNAQMTPEKDSVLKIDVYADESAKITFAITDLSSGEEFICVVPLLGGVWQSVMLDKKLFKNQNGVALSEFIQNSKFTVKCDSLYAVNNIMWL